MGELDLSKTEIGPFSWSYSERDTILYALGVGCHREEQRYVFEGHSDFAALPTLAVIPPYHDVLASVPLQDVLPKYNPVSHASPECLLERTSTHSSQHKPWH